MTPAGSITFLPKIHGPVSTTMKLPPASLVDSSTLPMLPSSASTLKPVKSTDGAVLLNVQISAIVICLNPFAKALAFDRVHDLLGTPLLALRPCAKTREIPVNRHISNWICASSLLLGGPGSAPCHEAARLTESRLFFCLLAFAA